MHLSAWQPMQTWSMLTRQCEERGQMLAEALNDAAKTTHEGTMAAWLGCNAPMAEGRDEAKAATCSLLSRSFDSSEKQPGRLTHAT